MGLLSVDQASIVLNMYKTAMKGSIPKVEESEEIEEPQPEETKPETPPKIEEEVKTEPEIKEQEKGETKKQRPLTLEELSKKKF